MIPLIIEADPSLDWKKNLVHVDQSNTYFTDRLRLVSFSTIVEIELANHLGIDLQHEDASSNITFLLDKFDQEKEFIPFQIPGDLQYYSWFPDRGIRVWLVQDGFFDQKNFNPTYVLDNGTKIVILEKRGVLEYIVSTSRIGLDMQHNGILTLILGPMFELLQSPNGQLRSNISSFYTSIFERKSPGYLSDMAGPTTVNGVGVPGFFLLVGR